MLCSADNIIFPQTVPQKTTLFTKSQAWLTCSEKDPLSALPLRWMALKQNQLNWRRTQCLSFICQGENSCCIRSWLAEKGPSCQATIQWCMGRADRQLLMKPVGECAAEKGYPTCFLMPHTSWDLTTHICTLLPLPKYTHTNPHVDTHSFTFCLCLRNPPIRARFSHWNAAMSSTTPTTHTVTNLPHFHSLIFMQRMKESHA